MIIYGKKKRKKRKLTPSKKASYPASKAKEQQVFDFVGFSFIY